MGPLHSPNEYLFHLYATSSAEAKRMWRRNIKEEWNHKCAYCGAEENLTIDHIVPQSKGGLDTTKNVVCCCKSCNHDKSHTPWENWYFSKEFFNEEKYQKIKNWMKPDSSIKLFQYRIRKNNVR